MSPRPVLGGIGVFALNSSLKQPQANCLGSLFPLRDRTTTRNRMKQFTTILATTQQPRAEAATILTHPN
jgi:hypothetical protein